jgi:hypothetical protein
VTKVSQGYGQQGILEVAEKRTRDFAVQIIKLSTALPNTPEGREIRRQITKSGISVNLVHSV